MNQLHIYPTSRAIRTVIKKSKEVDTFLPALMRMDEFEHRAILIENRVQIDPYQRILLLQEASKFSAFDTLKVDRSLIRFFTKSDALFKFFEELAQEKVTFSNLSEADAYAEFEEHINILEQLLKNYQSILESKGFIDKSFIPTSYKINDDFIESYEHIEIHIEGYLSYFELELLEKIAQKIELTLHYTTSNLNIKMQERFKDLDINLVNHSHVSFSMSKRKVLHCEKNHKKINSKLFSVEEREEQISLAFVKIEEMIKSGIQPEQIVLILPDESFKEHFTLFDTHHNLNFAMGYDYAKGYIYKSLDALYRYWQSYEDESKRVLERYGFTLENIEKYSSSKKIDIETFFTNIESLNLLDCSLVNKVKKEKYNQRVEEKYLHFLKIFEMQELSQKEWLFLWLKALSKITIDDVRGGLITVMGVLETRGVSFEGVVIVDFNEGIVPATSSKDQFLNSSVRAFANLPTKSDREALQKQYYRRLLEQAKESSIIYSSSDNKLPSKFLYELGLNDAVQTQAQFNLLYNQPSQLIDELEPIVENFDAKTIIWSASKLKIYLECKRRYYYKYIQNIKAKDEDEMNEGEFLHKVLEHLFNEKSFYTSKEEMQKALAILLERLHPNQGAKAEYQKLLWKEKLKGFIDTQIAHFNAGWKVVEREKEFQGEIGGLRFKGRIDRIDQNVTNTLLLDYKSGNVEKEPKRINPDKITDFQMSVYHQLLTEKYQNINLAFLKILENGDIQEVTLVEERNTLLAERIVELKQTTKFAAEKCEDLQKCKYCEFTLMCGRGEYL
ncbi:MAG: PD-(D/E)XK nuclease family protein [Campylobacterota bacterium]|nr:PD-(D/E)XK nuclease family protein [Campylobacterota bacterium]